MSREFWRLALICLLLAALPLSGFAAASMIGCAPVHRSAGGVQEALHPAHTSGHVQDASHHGEAGGHGRDTLDHAAAEYAEAGDHAHHAGHGTAGPHGVADDTQQCRRCAPCCVGMALFYDTPLRLADARAAGRLPARRDALSLGLVGLGSIDHHAFPRLNDPPTAG